MSGALKFQQGLRPITISTSEGPESNPCVFRRGGLAIAAIEVTEGTAYSITHEQSGRLMAPLTLNGTHALVTAAALLHLPLDWTCSADELRAQMLGLSVEHQSLLVCIRDGRTQFVNMAKAAKA
ncbi:hypothetical protein FJV41_39200 [Myxococcus llanfairpwllgwyngyllgogerychwyrndrobwllllantysiliogogogochensis]|uniref:Uncharacterized protein n=1 Tax=Myxococcus llanfairpwllgwyngyllgogerychwyrndrobwllllantysiliogogogochensis TaxID=2590453 RepID=A0A540WN97_9BACT|nr:hypothetical protein [Myxococcus llanfairpwllgwyngyllgogerychwyrndrobwllllantysiliogogogochensis]TQF10492.1 hypothetical protein FJV41_39200 [Myxococcus llanfairpwllgwyngyllgogerychwyrndrobwllllantysiliogogogochensis]